MSEKYDDTDEAMDLLNESRIRTRTAELPNGDIIAVHPDCEPLIVRSDGLQAVLSPDPEASLEFKPGVVYELGKEIPIGEWSGAHRETPPSRVEDHKLLLAQDEMRRRYVQSRFVLRMLVDAVEIGTEPERDAAVSLAKDIL